MECVQHILGEIVHEMPVGCVCERAVNRIACLQEIGDVHAHVYGDGLAAPMASAMR